MEALMAKKTRSTYRLPRKIASVKLPSTVRTTARDVFANPLARELLAAALVQVAAMLVKGPAARGSAARRFASDLKDAGLQAEKFGSFTIGQAVDMLLGYATGTQPEKARSARRKARPAARRKSAARKVRSESIAATTALH
jgi:hypothetical protein